MKQTVKKTLALLLAACCLLAVIGCAKRNGKASSVNDRPIAETDLLRMYDPVFRSFDAQRSAEPAIEAEPEPEPASEPSCSDKLLGEWRVVSASADGKSYDCDYTFEQHYFTFFKGGLYMLTSTDQGEAQPQVDFYLYSVEGNHIRSDLGKNDTVEMEYEPETDRLFIKHNTYSFTLERKTEDPSCFDNLLGEWEIVSYVSNDTTYVAEEIGMQSTVAFYTNGAGLYHWEAKGKEIECIFAFNADGNQAWLDAEGYRVHKAVYDPETDKLTLFDQGNPIELQRKTEQTAEPAPEPAAEPTPEPTPEPAIQLHGEAAYHGMKVTIDQAYRDDGEIVLNIENAGTQVDIGTAGFSSIRLDTTEGTYYTSLFLTPIFPGWQGTLSLYFQNANGTPTELSIGNVSYLDNGFPSLDCDTIRISISAED